MLNQVLPLTKSFNYSFYLQTSYSVSRCEYARLEKSWCNIKYAVLLFKDKSDEQLMEAYRDGDIKAFNKLYERFKDSLYRYLIRQTGETAIAEEIYQDSWAAVIKHRKNYIVKSSFKTYIFHIAHNKLIDFYRSKHNNKQDIISYDDGFDELYLATDSERDIEYQLDISKNHQKLLNSISNLPASQRDVFLLHEEAGMTLNEIAETMRVSRDTIKSRLKYALQKLRNDMERINERQT